MYYVWDADMRYWRRRVVQLDLDWQEGFPPLNNTCESLKGCLPPTLHYRLIPMNAPLLDQMWSASTFDVYSPAARKLLSDCATMCEETPAAIRSIRGQVISLEYSYVQVTTCVKAVDWVRSDVDVGKDWRGEPYVRHARRLVLKEEVVSRNIPVFRLEEKGSVVLASEEFRSEWERRGLTGAEFRSLDHYPKP